MQGDMAMPEGFAELILPTSCVFVTKGATDHDMHAKMQLCDDTEKRTQVGFCEFVIDSAGTTLVEGLEEMDQIVYTSHVLFNLCFNKMLGDS